MKNFIINLLFLEPERKLLLSEKIGNLGDKSEIIAHPNFCFIGTMNPGGDYGKKEVFIQINL